MCPRYRSVDQASHGRLSSPRLHPYQIILRDAQYRQRGARRHDLLAELHRSELNNLELGLLETWNEKLNSCHLHTCRNCFTICLISSNMELGDVDDLLAELRRAIPNDLELGLLRTRNGELSSPRLRASRNCFTICSISPNMGFYIVYLIEYLLCRDVRTHVLSGLLRMPNQSVPHQSSYTVVSSMVFVSGAAERLEYGIDLLAESTIG